MADLLPLEKISLNVARKRAEEIEGRRTALALFPEEVWRLILKGVDAPSDLWNVSQATQQLDDILSKEKGSIFFTKIFPILYSYLDTRSIYNCHLVCKLWNSTIESTLLNRTPNQRGIHPIPSEQPLNLSSVEQVDLAEETFLTTWNVPSFIQLNLNSNQLDEFLNSAKNLLPQFSTKVYHLKLVGCQRYAPPGLYNYLVEIFPNLSNLKILEIECRYQDRCMDLRVNALKRVIQGSRLACLKKLERMKLKFWKVPEEFLQEILKVYGKQLKSLELQLGEDDDQDKQKIWSDLLEFPVMEKLIVDVHSMRVLCDILRCMGKGKHLKDLRFGIPLLRDGEIHHRLIDDLKGIILGFKGDLKFFQFFRKWWNFPFWFCLEFRQFMGTWIQYNGNGNDDRNRVCYIVHAGPGLCK